MLRPGLLFRYLLWRGALLPDQHPRRRIAAARIGLREWRMLSAPEGLLQRHLREPNPDADEHTNEDPNQHTDEYANQHSDEYTDQHSNEHPNQHPDQHSDQYSDEYANADEYT